MTQSNMSRNIQKKKEIEKVFFNKKFYEAKTKFKRNILYFIIASIQVCLFQVIYIPEKILQKILM